MKRLTKLRYLLSKNRLARRSLLLGCSLVLGSYVALLLNTQICGLAQRTPAAEAPVQKPVPLVIVGAGISGLTAAFLATKMGLETELYEGSSRAGGRIRTVQNLYGTQLATNAGAELIDSKHDSILGLMRILNIQPLSRTPEPGINPFSILLDGNTYQSGELDRILFKTSQAALEIISNDRESIRRERLANPDLHLTATELRLDQMSVEDYLEKRAKAGPVLNKYLKSVIGSELNADLKSLSAVLLMSHFGVNLADQTVRFLPDHDEAYRVPGGTQVLIAQLKSKSPPIEFSSVLVSAILRPDHLTELTFKTPLGSKVVVAEKVILTLPLKVLAKIDIRVPEITDRIKMELAQSSFGQNTKLVLYFDERVWKKYGHAGNGVSDHGYQFWESSQGQAGNAGTITAYLGEIFDPILREEKVQQVLRDLEILFPGIKQHYKGRRFFSWPYSYSGVPKPGELTRLGKTSVVTNPGNSVFLAGEHWGADPGYMNAAVDSAQRAVFSAGAALLGTEVHTLTSRFGLGASPKCSSLFRR